MLLKSVDGGKLFQLLITRLAKKRLLSELELLKILVIILGHA